MSPVSRIILGDAALKLKELPDNSVHSCVTSPPYDDLRTYGQSKCEWNFNVIATELLRVLVPGGVIAWVVANQVKDWNESLTAERQRIAFQDMGFAVRKMVYHKLNFSAPNSTHYHRLSEDITLCCKGSKPATFNPISDIPTVWKKALGRNSIRERDGSMKAQRQGTYGEFGKRGDVWIGPTAGQENPCRSIDHPATMPTWLARDLIISWSNEGDTIIDPFAGSGTTGLMAMQYGRSFIGIELNPEYVDIAEKRIASVTPGFL